MATAEHFVEGFKTALKITKESPVVLEARSGRLFIGTYSEYHSVLYECPTEWEDFKVVLSQSVAKEIPKAVSGDTVKLEVGEGTMKLQSKGVKLNLSLLENGVLSLSKLVSKYNKEVFWQVSGSDFSATLDRVKHSANDKSIGDIVLRGYHLSKKDESLEVMASNGACLSVANTPLKEESAHGGTLLLNPEFSQVSQLLYEDTSISYNEDAISIESKNDDVTLRIVSLLTKGKSFDYEKVLNAVKLNDTFATFKTKDFLEAMRRSEFFTDENKKYKVGITLLADRAVISTDNLYGESSISLACLDTNIEDSIDIEISGINLISYLSSTKAETVTIRLLDESSPALFLDGFSKEVIVLFRK